MDEQNDITIAEVRSLRTQVEGHICDLVIQFEEITGLRVVGIRVSHDRKPGFMETDTISIDLETEL